MRRGFGLIEAMVAVALLALATGFALFYYREMVEEGRRIQALAWMATLRDRLVRRDVRGEVPPGAGLAAALGEDPGVDPWGARYRLDDPATPGIRAARLRSLGPDGIESPDDEVLALKLGKPAGSPGAEAPAGAGGAATSRGAAARRAPGRAGASDPAESRCAVLVPWNGQAGDGSDQPFYMAWGELPFPPLVPKPLWRGRRTLVRLQMRGADPDPREALDLERAPGWRFSVTLNGVPLAIEAEEELELVFPLFSQGSPARLRYGARLAEDVDPRRFVKRYAARLQFDAWDFCNNPTPFGNEFLEAEPEQRFEWYLRDAAGTPSPWDGGGDPDLLYTLEYFRLARRFDAWFPGWAEAARRE